MEYHLRKSKVLQKMRNGEVATSIKLNLVDPRGVELAALCGFDCIWSCYEHSSNNIETMENLIRASKIYDVDFLTRVSRGSYSDLIHPLESDSTGIMVPHLMSYEQAKEIVYYTKFHPIGRRPLDGGNADGAYCLVNPLDYISEANKERFVVVQIEDPEPLKDLEKICALDGIDMLFFGPADFSQGIGKPCQFGDKEIADTRKLVAECARKHGKWAGTTGNANNYDELVDLGYTFINVGSDVCGLADFYKDLVSKTNGRKIKKI